MEHRRLMILFAVISLFAFGVIIWYFLFAQPKSAPTLDETANPLSVLDLPARFAFIFGNDTPPEQTSTTEVTPGENIPFIKVWDKSSAGNVFVSRQVFREVMATSTVGTTTATTARTVRATTTVLLFVDRSTGHIYGYNPENGVTYQISNTTVPGVYDAYIFDGGNRIVMRHGSSDRKTIESILATIPNVQEGREPQGLFGITNLPQNIVSVAVSASLSLLSYAVKNDVGISIYTINSKGTSRVADSPLSEWSLHYGGEALYATTKASAYEEGFTVALPSFARILGGKTGLVSNAGGGGVILSSMWARSGLALFGTRQGNTVVSSAKTLASKCRSSISPYYICGVPKDIPSISEGLPDDWYQGRILFDDRLMIVNAANGESFTLYEFEEKYGDMDVTNISQTQRNELISFIRKQDGSLYLLNTELLADTSNE